MERLPLVRWTMIGVAGLLLCAPAWAQFGRQNLDPADYVSPSGEYVLHVDPTERHGAGPAQYALRRWGETVWARTLPFTFQDAIVTDRGTALGVALTEGSVKFEAGLFVVAVLTDDGQVAVRHEKARKSHAMHAADQPFNLGIVQAGTRGIVRMFDSEVSGSEAWWVYDLVAQERTRVLFPRDVLGGDERRRFLDAVRPVSGTPLLIIHWTHRPQATGHGAIFTLVDEDLGVIWSLELPGDYAGLPKPVQRALGKDLDAGMGLGDATDGRFSILHYRDGVYATHEVERTEDDWTVREVARVKLPEVTEEDAPTIEPITLEALGSFVLDEAAAERPSEYLIEWEVVDAAGTIEGIWRSSSASLEWRRLGPDGTTRETQSIELPHWPRGSTCWARRPDGAWILANDPYDDSAPLAWTFEPESGAVTPIEGFRGPPPDEMCASADGFAVIGTRRRGGSSSSSVAVYDADGSLRWRSDAFSPEDVAIGPSGQVLVLDVIRHQVTIFSADGKRTALIDLEELWGQEPNYPSGMETAPDGRFLVLDFNGEPLLWVMTADGESARALDLSLADGSSPDDLAYRARFGPNGRLWSSDGHLFYRFDQSGMVDRTIGEPPDPTQIHEPNAAISDPAGRLYVFDERTAVVHVFNASGQRVHRCTPVPGDYPSVPWSPRMSVDGRGHLFVPRGAGDYVEYDEAGRRVGVSVMPKGDLAFLPRERDAWMGQYEEVIRVDAAGKETLRIERRHDRTWLEAKLVFGVAPDGSLAVSSGGLNLYGRDGGSRARHVLPSGRTRGIVYGLVYGKDWIAFKDRGEGVLLVRVEDGALRLFDPSLTHPENGVVDLMRSPDGRELWLFERSSQRLTRYAFPDAR